MGKELEPKPGLRTRAALVIERWIDSTQEPPLPQTTLKKVARLAAAAGIVVGGAVGADHISGLHYLPTLTNKATRPFSRIEINNQDIILTYDTSTSIDTKYYIFNAHPGLTLRISPKAIGILTGNSRVGINLPGHEVGIAVFTPIFANQAQEEASRFELANRAINPILFRHHGTIEANTFSVYTGVFLKDLQRKGLDPLQNLEKLSSTISLTWVDRLRELTAKLKGERFTPLTTEIEFIVKNNLPIVVDSISPEALARELYQGPTFFTEGVQARLNPGNSATFPNGIVADYIEAKIVTKLGVIQSFLRDPQFGINAPKDFLGINLIVPGNQKSETVRRQAGQLADSVEPSLMHQFIREQQMSEGVQATNFFYATSLILATLDKNPQLDPYGQEFLRAMDEELSAAWYRATMSAVNGIRPNTPPAPLDPNIEQIARNRRLFQFLEIDQKLIDEALRERALAR